MICLSNSDVTLLSAFYPPSTMATSFYLIHSFRHLILLSLIASTFLPNDSH